MPTVKTVEVNFTFAYVDKRRKYTSKDFGLKSIPYGESDETETDGGQRSISQRRRVIHLIKRPGRLCDWVFFLLNYFFA